MCVLWHAHSLSVVFTCDSATHEVISSANPLINVCVATAVVGAK